MRQSISDRLPLTLARCISCILPGLRAKQGNWPDARLVEFLSDPAKLATALPCPPLDSIRRQPALAVDLASEREARAAREAELQEHSRAPSNELRRRATRGDLATTQQPLPQRGGPHAGTGEGDHALRQVYLHRVRTICR